MVFGYAGLIYCFEKAMNFKIHIFSLLTIVFIPLRFLLPNDIYESSSSFIVPLGFFFMCFTILQFLKTSPDEEKPIALFLFIGLQFFLLGFFLTLSIVKNLQLFPLKLGPIFFIVACVIWIIPVFIKQELIKKLLKALKKIPILLFVLSGFILFYTSFFGIVELEIDQITAILASFILISFMLGFYILMFKNLGIEQESVSDVKLKEFSAIFSKPKKLTEEEVSVSKEKKVCLVCKNSIKGINFLCFECGTLYCEKCFRALTELENACWACDNALDQTKPVKLEKKKDTELEIDTDIHKEMKKKN